MLFCGIGETALDTLLGALNLPSVSPTKLRERDRQRDREREADIALEAVVYETCQKALREKKGRQGNTHNLGDFHFKQMKALMLISIFKIILFVRRTITVILESLAVKSQQCRGCQF